MLSFKPGGWFAGPQEGGWQGGWGGGQDKKLEGGEWKYERQWFLFPDVQPPHQNLYGVFSIPSLLSSVTWMVWGVTLMLFHVGISSLLVGIVPRFVICFLNSVFGLNLWLHCWWPLYYLIIWSICMWSQLHCDVQGGGVEEGGGVGGVNDLPNNWVQWSRVLQLYWL